MKADTFETVLEEGEEVLGGPRSDVIADLGSDPLHLILGLEDGAIKLRNPRNVHLLCVTSVQLRSGIHNLMT